MMIDLGKATDVTKSIGGEPLLDVTQQGRF